MLGDAGRNVRCAKCAHKWRQMPPKVEAPEGTPIDLAPEPEPTPPSPATPSPSQPDPNEGAAAPVSEPSVEIPAAPPRPRSPQRPTGPITVPPKLRPVLPKRRGLLRPIYLLLAGLVIGLGMFGLYQFRAEIARAVPAFDMVYSLMGISTSSAENDLVIGNLKFDRRSADGKTVISVQGDIFNKSEFPVRIPNMTAIALGKDADGNPLALMPDHKFRLEQEAIEPGETISFRTFFENPPKGAKSMMVDFLK